jgi:hypothetical protein
MITRLLLLLLVTNVSMAQDLEKTYQELTSKVNEINKYMDHEIVKIESEDLTDVFDGQAWLTGFYKDGIIQKMTLVVENDLGVMAFNYFLDQGKLIYISETFDKFLSSDKLKSSRSFKGKYFFKDNKMFDRDGTGSNRFTDETLNPETILLAETAKNVDLLNKMKSNAMGKRN